MDEEKLNAVMQQLADQMREYNDNLSRFARTSSGSERSNYASYSSEELKKLGESASRLKNLQGDELNSLRGELKYRGQLNEAIKHSIDAELKRIEQVKALSTASKSLVSGIYNLRDTVNDISGDMTKFNGAIKSAGDGAFELGKMYGKKGVILGGTIKALSVLTDVTLRQTDSLLKAFDSLSEVGGTTNITTAQIRELGSAAGYSVANLDKFLKPIKSLGLDIGLLGSTAAQGVQTFSKMAAVGNETYRAFNRLGISQEELTEAQARFIKQSGNVGTQLSKSPMALQKASLEYLDTLVQLRDLHGISIKQQQDALDTAKNNDNFNTYMMQKRLQRAEIEKQIESTNDPIVKKQLEARAAEITQIIKNKEAYATYATSTYDAAQAARLLQSISTDGAPIITESNKELILQNRNLGELNRTLVTSKDVNAGINLERAQNAKATKELNQNLGELASALGTNSSEINKTFGISNEMRNATVRNLEMTTEAGRKRIEAEQAEAQANIERRKKEGEIIDANGNIVRDTAKDVQNAYLTFNREVAKFKDAIIAAVNPFTGSLFGAIAGIGAFTFAAVKAAGMLRGMTGLGGLGSIGGGGALSKLPLGKIGGGLGLGAAGYALGELGSSVLGKESTAGKVSSTLGSAATGAGLGMMFGPLGAAIGGLGGLAYGTFSNFSGNKKSVDSVAESATASTMTTTSDGGQKAVNVNIVGSVPINVNIEKVLDPLFRMAQNPKSQSESAGALPPGIKVPGVTSAQEFGTRSKIATQTISSQMTSVLSGSANVSGYTESDLRQMGLNLKKGDVQREGAGIDARLIELAKTLQSMVPGITFTGFADQYHAEKAPNSEHNRGRAFDFVLPPKLAQDADYRKQLVNELNGMGAFVIDEYSYPSAKSTGGHIHVAISTGAKPRPMARGGMILGPGSSTSDSVPAFNKDTGQPIALSTGEYVLPASVTSMLGRGYLDSLISSPNTLKRQGGGTIPGEDGQKVISAAVDLGEGMREIIYSDGSRELSGGFGTRFFDPSGKLVKTRTPNFAGLHKEIHADGGVDTHYAAGPMSFSQYASGRKSASYNLGMAKISSDTEKGNMIDIFNEDRTERLTSIDQINTLLEQYKNDDSEMKTVLETVKEIFQQMMDKNESLFTEMNSTLKDVVGELEESNSTQEDILNYSRI